MAEMAETVAPAIAAMEVDAKEVDAGVAPIAGGDEPRRFTKVRGRCASPVRSLPGAYTKAAAGAGGGHAWARLAKTREQLFPPADALARPPAALDIQDWWKSAIVGGAYTLPSTLPAPAGAF